MPELVEIGKLAVGFVVAAWGTLFGEKDPGTPVTVVEVEAAKGAAQGTSAEGQGVEAPV